MDFKEIYHQPFDTDEMAIWVTCKTKENGIVHCLDILTDDKEYAKENVAILNGQKEGTPENKATYSASSQLIYRNNKRLFLVRGWGYLTGIGGLKLNPKIAAELQDNFGQWCADMINGKK